MKKKKITHRLIAAECGVACSTVTRVLTGAQNVAPSTRAFILETARKLGYHTTKREKRAVLIAVVYAWISVRNVYDTQLVEMLERAVHAKGWGLVLVSQDSLSIFKDWIFSGIISIAYNKEIEKLLAEKNNMPIVTINSFSSHMEQIYSTYSDDEATIAKGIAYLKQLGHSRIVVFSRTPSSMSFIEKKRYHAARRNMPEDSENYVIIESTAQLKAELHLAKSNGFTAGIIMIEMMPILLQHIFDTLDFKIPDDFSLIVKDIGGMFQYLKPAPTTFEQNLKVLAQNAVDMIEEIRNGKASQVRDRTVENIFHPRETTIPLPPQKRTGAENPEDA